MTYWAELLELYEYKVEDLLADRRPRGGRRSLAALRDDLMTAPLEPALQRRLVTADRRYRAFLKGERVDPVALEHVPRPQPAGRSRWSDAGSGGSEAARAWNELQRLVWHASVKRDLLEAGRVWQQEPSLVTLRVVYAALENAERSRGTGRDWQAVPEEHDTLMSLDNAEVLGRLVQGLADLLLRPAGRGKLRTELLNIQEDPFPRHADEDVLAARLEAVGREPLSAEAREALRQALRAQYPPPRDPRERPAIREAAQRLLALLEEMIARAPGVVPGRLSAHVLLHAPDETLALARPDDASDELFIYLPGGQGTQWRGLDIRWFHVASAWQVQISSAAQSAQERAATGGQVALLRPGAPEPERSALLTTSRGDLRAFISGPYLLLRVESSGQDELLARAALARAVAALMRPAGTFAALRLARAVTASMQGERLDLGALHESSAEPYLQASGEALLDAARRAAEVLVPQVARLTPEDVARHLQGAAQALHVDVQEAAQLHEALHRAAFPEEKLPDPTSQTLLTLQPNGEYCSVRLADDPVTVQVADRRLTVRLDYKGDRLAVLPGLNPVVVGDVLVLTVPGLRVMLVRHRDWLAVAAETDRLPLRVEA